MLPSAPSCHQTLIASPLPPQQSYHPNNSLTPSLGATINMDGTAMYLGLATLFGAQIFGVELSGMDYVTIALLATVGAIGAAGVYFAPKNAEPKG